MSKSYGLIIPNKQKEKTVYPSNIQKKSVFGDESSSESSGEDIPKIRGKHQQISGPGAVERRQAKSIQQKALAEDPTIFQYDELYDEIETKREEEKKQNTEERKPKYIGRLLQQAERRKLENERRIERQVQKEREAEGDQFKDKESFVTSAYKKKLEELKKAEEEEKREEYLEAIGDVTKQGNLDGFYRHLYEQKLGAEEQDNKIITNKKSEKEDIHEEPSKTRQNIKPRTYRKRISSDDDTENENSVAKRAHIQSNLDADSDFSIDDSSSEDENENHKNDTNTSKIEQPIKTESDIKQESSEKECHSVANEIVKTEPDEDNSEKKQQKHKEKIDVWKKRTIGDIFDAALQRYYERKSARQR
ncbi:nuclear speckle splicing regulatory protein 1 [Condylostylus longicornis]|uniref:nuclear speckle splicing regulatory protein 1 n=1 Tax=Condylostylus longicornis TaxID=2530218 RepID=UPI00244DC0B3|nr:nuclear speckle splicing regulatory protein 1 [Condylostylus longicornis]